MENRTVSPLKDRPEFITSGYKPLVGYSFRGRHCNHGGVRLGTLFNDNESSIVLSKEQVDQLIEWLQKGRTP
jgi:hypothetical protein